MKKRLNSLLIFIFYVVIPTCIILIRHTNLADRTTFQKIGFTVLLISAIPIYLWQKKNNERMKIKRNKEIEDDNRTVSNELYFMKRFAFIYIIVYIALRMISFNFSRITMTLIMIASSLLIGAIIRIIRIQAYKV